MKVLSIDLSTHTGYAFYVNNAFVEYGTLEPQKTFDKYSDYPFSYVNFAEEYVKFVVDSLVVRLQPEVIVIEQTTLGRQRWSQKKLEFLHCVLLLSLREFKGKVVYVDVSAWRQKLDMKATKEDLTNNRKVNAARRKGLKKSDLGLIGKITPKHRAIRYVNEALGLNFRMRDNNTCDAICLILAYLQGVRICDGK
jgi:hypothetical protein